MIFLFRMPTKSLGAVILIFEVKYRYIGTSDWACCDAHSRLKLDCLSLFLMMMTLCRSQTRTFRCHFWNSIRSISNKKSATTNQPKNYYYTYMHATKEQKEECFPWILNILIIMLQHRNTHSKRKAHTAENILLTHVIKTCRFFA